MWVNQVEIPFSVNQRKVLTPRDIMMPLAEVENRLLRIQASYWRIARQLQWKLTRHDLTARLALPLAA